MADRAGQLRGPMLEEELEFVFLAVKDGRRPIDARRELSLRDSNTVNRAYKIVADFERLGLKSLDGNLAEEIAGKGPLFFHTQPCTGIVLEVASLAKCLRWPEELLSTDVAPGTFGSERSLGIVSLRSSPPMHRIQPGPSESGSAGPQEIVSR